jgi:hypothetical protein
MDQGLAEIKARLDKAANIKEINKRLEARKKKEDATEEAWSPIDIYQSTATRRWEESKKQYPKGSSSLVRAVVKNIIDGDDYSEGLARAKRMAEDDSEALKKRGEMPRAKLVRQQYMEDKFLPSIEAVIDYSSPDELLNCREALSALDEMALGDGAMKGYTASYVRQAYGNQLGKKQGESDPTVIDTVRRIRMLVDDDQYRTAIGLAKKIKKSIDDGENIASDDDYSLIGRVVAYAN